MKFFIKDFFSKCEQILSFLRVWLDLLKKSHKENFIFCAVHYMKGPGGKGFWYRLRLTDKKTDKYALIIEHVQQRSEISL